MELKNGSRVELLGRSWIICVRHLGSHCFFWTLADTCGDYIRSVIWGHHSQTTEEAALADLQAFLDKNAGKVIG